MSDCNGLTFVKHEAVRRWTAFLSPARFATRFDSVPGEPSLWVMTWDDAGAMVYVEGKLLQFCEHARTALGWTAFPFTERRCGNVCEALLGPSREGLS